uniref:Spaetzle domain-containing protein n=1 Tax=Strigamia maritima TaxID=126957 RepID=T1ISL6_STRMM
MLKITLVGLCIWISFATLETQHDHHAMYDKLMDQSKPREMAKKKATSTKFNRKSDKTGHGEKVICEPTPLETLNRILGPGFNARYMAVEKPQELRVKSDVVDEKVVNPNEQRDARMIRQHDEVEDFAVDPNFSRILSDTILSREKRSVDLVGLNDEKEEKNVMTNFLETMGKATSKTSKTTETNDRLWTCEWSEHWLDLGNDYFPRYIRTAKCTTEKCWFNFFKCEGRAFTVKVLRKRQDECISHVNNKTVILLEDWVFEERAVNFCCVCVPVWKKKKATLIFFFFSS